MIKISKNITWFTPYLELAIPYLPEGIKISRITAWSKLKGRYGRDCQACIITNDKESFRLYFHLSTHPRGEIERPYSRIELLELFAHELAHTAHMEHTPEHKKLEAKLITVFMSQLKREGYVSEEEESKT